MHRVYDEAHGYRDLDDDQFQAWQAKNNADLEAFWDRQVWRPIAEFDRESGKAQLLSNGPDWAFGYWGPGSRNWCEEADDLRPTWRNAQESLMEQPLTFEPMSVGIVDDEDRRVAFMADI